MGWFGFGCLNCTVRNIDVIRAEWRKGGYAGDGVICLAGDNNTDVDVFYNDILFENIRIDTPLGRIVGIDIIDVDVGINHIFAGMTVRNVTSRAKLQWTTDAMHNISEPGQQLLSIYKCDGHCQINNINFENIYIAGNKVTDDTDWNLDRSGQIITNITYS